jgi:TonB family protein
MPRIRWDAIGFMGMLIGCGGGRQNGDDAAAASNRDDPPVALDPEPLVDYPTGLYSQGIEGTVILRLYVDSLGAVVKESTQVAESSGYPEFDSAALAGVPRMHFAPAQRDGRPVASEFKQPVHFRKNPPPASATTP